MPALPAIMRPISKTSFKPEILRAAADDLRVGERVGRRRVVLAIGDAETAAEVDMAQAVPIGHEVAGEIGEELRRVVERRELGDLAADMGVDADDGEAGKAGRVRVDLPCARDRHAELVFRAAGRDLAMRSGVDVGIDADRNRRLHPFRQGHLGERRHLRLALDVEAQDAGVEARGHLGARLADAREDDALARHPGGARAAQLALRDDVHAGAEAREGLQHRLVGIRLDGVADERLAADESLGEDAVMPRQRGGRVAVERRPDRVRQARPRTTSSACMTPPR